MQNELRKFFKKKKYQAKKILHLNLIKHQLECEKAFINLATHHHQ
jgi:hypothetical protein